MTDIAPLYRGAETESPKPEVPVPKEGHLPWGRPVSSVQPHPMPLITAKEPEKVLPDERAQKEHVAQTRADMTGIGGLVDVIV